MLSVKSIVVLCRLYKLMNLNTLLLGFLTLVHALYGTQKAQICEIFFKILGSLIVLALDEKQRSLA